MVGLLTICFTVVDFCLVAAGSVAKRSVFSISDAFPSDGTAACWSVSLTLTPTGLLTTSLHLGPHLPPCHSSTL